MSSIFGIIHTNQSFVNSDQASKMKEALSYWEPDASTIWQEKNASLGQLMLWTTPESLNEQLPYSENQLTITADARIDNREEILRLLGINRKLEDTSDSWIILKAYEKWKEECPKQLVGEFAFVIWDQSEQILFCAKDHLGTRPLYYSFSKGVFIFSTEIKGILATGVVPKELNETMVAFNLLRFNSDKKQTLYQNIFALEPAHWLRLSGESLITNEYWTLNINQELKVKNKIEYQEGFRHHLRQSIQRRTRSAFPIGSLLSGGLDSTSVTGMMLKENLNTTDLHFYSWVHPEGQEKEYEDDREFIDDFLKLYKGKKFNHQYLSGLDGYYKVIDGLQKNVDSIFRDIEGYTRHQSNIQANTDGVRLMLGGIGGDELVSAHVHEYIFNQFLRLNWTAVFNELRAAKKHRNQSNKSLFKKYIYRYLRALSQGKEPWLKGHRFVGQNLFLEGLKKDTYFNPNLFEKIQHIAADYQLPHHLSGSLKQPLKRTLLLQTYDGNFNVSFNHRYYGSINQKVQYTYPLLDRDLLTYCMQLPIEQFFLNGKGRGLIRRNMAPYLTNDILERTSKFASSPYLRTRYKEESPWILEKIKEWETHAIIPNYIDLNKLKHDVTNIKNGTHVFTKELTPAISTAIFLESKF